MNGGSFTHHGAPLRDSTTISVVVLSARDLVRLQLRTAFLLDRQGRLLAVNEPHRPEAPRVFLAIAGAERLVRVRHNVPEAVAREWLACAGDDAALAARVAAHQPITNQHRGPAYVLPPLNAELGQTIFVRSAGDPPLHPELVARGWGLTEPEPYAGVVRDGHIVAVCYSSRDGAEACEAGVETATTYRGQGLGALVVRAWAAAVQRSGRHALYSTSWDNLPSQRIAARLGARQYGENWHLA